MRTAERVSDHLAGRLKSFNCSKVDPRTPTKVAYGRRKHCGALSRTGVLERADPIERVVVIERTSAPRTHESRSSLWVATNSDLSISHNDEETRKIEGQRLKDCQNSLDQSCRTRFREANDHHPRAYCRLESSHVAEISILRYQEASFAHHGIPYHSVGLAAQSLLRHGVDIVPSLVQSQSKRSGQILVEFDSHATFGMGGRGISSSAEAAAYAIAARRWSFVSVGNSRWISSGVSPSASDASTVRRVTRVPAKTGCPARIEGFEIMCLRQSNIA